MRYVLAVILGSCFGVFALLAADFQVTQGFDVRAVAAVQFDDHPGLLMWSEKEKVLRRNMPRIEDHDSDWSGIYYTETEMPPAFQMGGGFHSTAYDLSGGADFRKVGHGHEFPWKHPGGLDNARHYTWKILQLPQGTKVKAFWNSSLWDWTFPAGTRFVEVLSFDDELRVFEIRTRQKRVNGTWETKRFFPFTGKGELVDAGGEFKSSKVWRLRDTLHRSEVAFPEMRANIDDVSGSRKLLQGRAFKESGWAPSTDDAEGIVPRGYEGAFAVRNCNNCHDSTAQPVRKFDRGRDWYGNVRGGWTEGIISFHPIDPHAISGNGFQLQARPNPRLAKVLTWGQK